MMGGLKAMVAKIWTAVSKLFPWLAPFAGLLSLYAVYSSNYDAVVAYLNGLSVYLAGNPTSGFLALANRFFPISEALTMVLALFTFRKLAFVARFVRAMMPF